MQNWLACWRNERMIFSLRNYRDLGRCSLGTLRDVWDTDKDEIYLQGKKVEINRIEDLFPFLWQPAGSWCRNGDHTVSNFGSEGTHWHHDYDKSVERCERNAGRYRAKMEKAKSDSARENHRKRMESELEHAGSIRRMVERLDIEMRTQQAALIAENSI